MVEPVATARLFDDDAGLGRLVERVNQILLDHLLHEVQGEPAADDRGCGKGLVGLDREPRKSAAYGFSHSPLERGGVPEAAALVDMAQSLDQKERVAAGDGGQCVAELFVVVAGFGDV